MVTANRVSAVVTSAATEVSVVSDVKAYFVDSETTTKTCDDVE